MKTLRDASEPCSPCCSKDLLFSFWLFNCYVITLAYLRSFLSKTDKARWKMLRAVSNFEFRT